MNLRRLLCAALMASVLTSAAACGGTEPDGPPQPPDTQGPDAGVDGGPDAGEAPDAGEVPDAGDPASLDSDCDGLRDGEEDVNGNGAVDVGESDPQNADTDGDGLPDGVESGVTENPQPTLCPDFQADADPATTTNPTQADTDGDGIGDGLEDTNHNGRHDEGELDPLLDSDGGPLVSQVCFTDGPRAVTFRQLEAAGLRLALPVSFTDDELQDVMVEGTARGVLGYDADSHVALLAFTRGQVGTSTTPEGDEAGLRTDLGAGEPSTTQHFTTWEGVPALQATYSRTTSGDLTAYVNGLAERLVGSGAGVLTGETGVSGTFHVQAELVHRADQSVVVVLAVTSTLLSADPALPSRLIMEDIAGGAALAPASASDGVRCERPTLGRDKVDFLFVVDDSGSMANSQAALAAAGNDIAARLASASLAWRIGMVTTSYTASSVPNAGVFRGFTDSIAQFQAWLTQVAVCDKTQQMCTVGRNALADTHCTSNAECWVNITGAGSERPLDAAHAALEHAFAPGSPSGEQVRPDARLVVVLLTDTRDHSLLSLSEAIDYFETGNPTHQPVVVHGILCPMDGTACAMNEDPPDASLADVISSAGGVQGSIRNAASIRLTMNAIVDDTLAATGYALGTAPVGASVRVGLESVMDPGLCPSQTDLPRSRVNGFDVSGIHQTLSFYGACRPATTASGTSEPVVSYRAWRAE